MAIKQSEAYLYMGVAKRQSNDEIHFRQGRFTTCDQEEPHYHFQLSKAVMIPEKRIVTGPMNLWVNGVPTPLGLPFSIIPQQKKRTQGILFPQIIPFSSYGFGVQDLGYFLPINDHLHTMIYTTLYSRGSWGLRNHLDYSKKYQFRGSLDLAYQQFSLGFPSYSRSNRFSTTWMHSKDPKSNPFWNFSSNVNFTSDNQSKNNLDPLNANYFNNSLSSDINLNRIFPGKPITMGMKLSIRQNSIARNIALISPILNVNVTRFYPFKKIKLKPKALNDFVTKIGMTYNLEGQNKSVIGDSLLSRGQFKEIGEKFMNGISQSTSIQTTAGLFKNALKITPSINYTNKINFQQTEKNYNPITNTTKNDTIYKMGMLHELSFNMQLTSIVYAYYKFVGKRQSLLRHLLTPSVGFRYIPQLNNLVTANVGVNQSAVTYSPFERSIYTGGTGKNAAQITFSVNNTFELKQKSAKDTVTGFKKTRIIDLFSINGNYDLIKDSMKLSDLSLNLRVSPAEWVNFVASSSFSPYAWVDSTGRVISKYAVQGGQGLGRFMSIDLSTTFTLVPKSSEKELEKSKEILSSVWNADYMFYALHPEYILNFNIPWKLNLSHVYSLTRNTNKSSSNPEEFSAVHTLVLNGDASFTKRWNMSGTINLDMKTGGVTNARFTLSRNLHCWALSFNVTPIGYNKSFVFTIRNTSSMFQSAKLDIRRPPLFL